MTRHPFFTGYLKRAALLLLATFTLLSGISLAQTNTFKVSTSHREVGKKLYAQADHLASIRSVVTDTRIAQRTGTTIQGFAPRVDSWTETYAFGSNAPARHISGNYRYSFNGMEQDDELMGEGNAYTSDFRLYDPRVGRWMSTDPVRHFNWSPYNAFDNNPIALADPSGADADGGWDIVYTETVLQDDNGEYTELTIIKREWNPNIDANRFVLAECPKPGDTRVGNVNGEKYKLTYAPPPYAFYRDFYSSEDNRLEQYSVDINHWLDYADENLSDVSHDDRLYYADEHDPDMVGFNELLEVAMAFRFKVRMVSAGSGASRSGSGKTTVNKNSQTVGKKRTTNNKANKEPAYTPSNPRNRIPAGNKANHIFPQKNRIAKEKFLDTPANRNKLHNVANTEKNYLGTDRYGKQWHSEMIGGQQVYTYSQGGVVRGGGFNSTPRNIVHEQCLTK